MGRAAGRSGGKGEAWWPTLARVAGADMDFAIIHQYFPVSSYERFAAKPLGAGREAAALRDFLARTLPGRTVPIALTEWNTNKDAGVRGAGQALAVAELVGDHLVGGVDMACYWPMRYGGSSGFRTLLDHGSHEPRPPYHVLKLFASNLGAKLVACESSDGRVFACAGQGREAGEIVVFLVNKSPDGQPAAAEIAVAGAAPSGASATSLAASSPQDEQFRTDSPPVRREGAGWSCRLPAYSLTCIKFRK
jgi:hypothetical protein